MLLAFELPAFGGTPSSAVRRVTPSASATEPINPNAFIAIDRVGIVTITVPVVEMGQGTYTSVPMLIAEELEVDLENLRARHAPVAKVYGNPGRGGLQETGASSSMRGLYVPMRKAGATARAMLVEAAAHTWRVPTQECAVAHGVVVHAPSGRRLTYGALADKAARLPIPGNVVLKEPERFTLLGKPAQRLDIASKVNGTAQFGIDAAVPGMKLAGVVACPVFGGKLAAVDGQEARNIRGVHQIVQLPDAVAVIADHTGAVRKALAALKITWDNGPNADFSTARWSESLRAASRTKGGIAIDKGDARKRIEQAAIKFSAIYEAPALAHATMEPMNCTVQLSATECQVWTGTQSPAKVQAAVARLTGLPLESIAINNSMIGGGFGRRLETDFVEQAVRIAQQAQVPVKVIWSREEDIRHDYYRPYYYDELAAAFDASGKPLAFSHRIVGSSIITRSAGGHLKGLDSDAVRAADGPYDFPSKYIEYVPCESPVPTGFFRGVGANHNTCVIEGFIDEVANHLSKDPFEFRRSLLTQNPRALAVLERVAHEINWGRQLLPRHGHGIAVIASWDSFMALALEVGIDENGRVSLQRLVAALDCGQQINPDGIVAQTQSGVIFGLTSALYGRITVEAGRIQQSNFHDYPMVRIHEVPRFDVHLIESHEKPGGVGEIGTTLASPALLNAVYAATGKRIRQLPLDPPLLALDAIPRPRS